MATQLQSSLVQDPGIQEFDPSVLQTGIRTITPGCELVEMAYPAGVRVRFSAPNAAHFCYVTAGSLADTNPQHPSTFGTGQLIYFPQNRRHLVEVLQPIRCLVVRLGPQLLSRPGVDSQAMAEPVPVPGWEVGS